LAIGLSAGVATAAMADAPATADKVAMAITKPVKAIMKQEFKRVF
jgi:hypothetical protein